MPLELLSFFRFADGFFWDSASPRVVAIVHTGVKVPACLKTAGAWYLLRGVDGSGLRTDSGAFAQTDDELKFCRKDKLLCAIAVGT